MCLYRETVNCSTGVGQLTGGPPSTLEPGKLSGRSHLGNRSLGNASVTEGYMRESRGGSCVSYMPSTLLISEVHEHRQAVSTVITKPSDYGNQDKRSECIFCC